eukprot:SAG11_NODE_1595_length_4611_cov_7.390957_4_plen_326_part_00
MYGSARRGFDASTLQQQQSTLNIQTVKHTAASPSQKPHSLPPSSFPPEMLQKLAATAAFLLCAGGGAAHQPPDISQLGGLGGLDMEGLKQFIGSMWTHFEGQIDELKGRVDSCEAQGKNEDPVFMRRQTQEQSSSACGIEAVQSMLAVCCPGGEAGNGHRLLQADGCDSLPPTCSLECSSQFISIFENCQGQPVLEQLPPGQLARWTGFLGQCQEVQQSAAELSVADAQPAMIFHCLVLDDAAQSHAEMFGEVTSPVLPLGPLRPIVTPPSPTPASDGGAAQVQEFRRVCTRANLTVCAPPCNQASDGFLLSILIGGRDTMMTCN